MSDAFTTFVPDRIWLHGYPVSLAGTRFDARMALIRLNSGRIIIHSPCEITEGIAAQISKLGVVAHIIAPGNFHTLHIASAQAVFPDAKTWICPGVERRRPELKYDGILDDDAPEEWAQELEQMVVRGTRVMREVAFLHKESRTLILVDLIENFTDATPNIGGTLKFWFKYVLRMWDNPKPAPEYWVGWKRARESLKRILEWDFNRIVLSHGDLIEAEAKATARKAWGMHQS